VPFESVTAAHLVACALAIEARGAPEYAKRALQTAAQIGRYAVAHSIAVRNAAADIKPADVLKPMKKVNYPRLQKKSGVAPRLSRQESLDAWKQIFLALANSTSKDDQALAKRVADFVKEMPMMARATAFPRAPDYVPLDRGRESAREQSYLAADRTRNGPEIER